MLRQRPSALGGQRGMSPRAVYDQAPSAWVGAVFLPRSGLEAHPVATFSTAASRVHRWPLPPCQKPHLRPEVPIAAVQLALPVYSLTTLQRKKQRP